MFTHQKLLFQFTKAIALVILLCFTFSYQAQGEKAVKEKAKDVEVAAIDQEVVDVAKITAQFVVYVEELFDDLESAFKNSEFGEMADLLGDNAILATPQGKRLKGLAKLRKFWEKQKSNEITKVEFTLKVHYVSEIADPIVLDPIEDTINAVGHAIIEYRLITIIGGGTLTNKTGTLTLNERHPRRCTWGH